MARSIVDICNEALGEVPADLIADINDDSSLSARHCKRLLPAVISDLLEFHDFDFATTRVALASTYNQRAGEWAFAYALPADMRAPKQIVPHYENAGGYPVSFAGMSVTGQAQSAIEYVIADNLLYTNLENAWLEYSRDNVPVTRFPSLFARAVALEMASRLVMPINPDSKRKEELVRQAEIAKARAVAADANRNNDRSIDFMSDRALARGVDMVFGR